MAKGHFSGSFSTINPPSKPVPVTKPIPGREADMTPNKGGGYSFNADSWLRLERFLVIGSCGGTYYTKQETLTKENGDNIIECIKQDGPRVVEMIVDVSDNGRSVKNDYAIFALALCTSPVFASEATQKAAWAAMPKVCRIGTHLFLFNQICDQHRRWGPARRKAVSRWYDNKKANDVALQLIKYQGRNTSEGDKSSRWSHCDVIRKAHPFSKDPLHNALYDYATHLWEPSNDPDNKIKMVSEESRKLIETENALRLIVGHEKVQKATTAKEVIALIKEYRLPRESIPTQFQNDADVWRALLPDIPLTGLIRSLGRMTSYGVIAPMSEETKTVCNKLTDAEYVKKSRMHPLSVLIAMKQYALGHGDKGDMKWTPVQAVLSALEKAFYASFTAVEPTGKNILIALDVSGSMTGTGCAGLSNFSCAEGTAVMSLATAKIEDESNYAIIGFADTTRELGISPRMDLNDVMKKISGLSFGSTNPAAAIEYASKKNMKVDAFVIYSDGEANTGQHVMTALNAYRSKMNSPRTKLICVNMISSMTRMTDKKDPLVLEVVGFDTNTPAAINSFISM